jgi:hypothetical protein
MRRHRGCNDGAAFPFLVSPAPPHLVAARSNPVLTHVRQFAEDDLVEEDEEDPVPDGFSDRVSSAEQEHECEVIARKVLKFSKRRELIDRESMVAMYVALSLLVTALFREPDEGSVSGFSHGLEDALA